MKVMETKDKRQQTEVISILEENQNVQLIDFQDLIKRFRQHLLFLQLFLLQYQLLQLPSLQYQLLQLLLLWYQLQSHQF